MIRWISAVSRRFARVDRKGRSAVTSALATLGICFGVMTLTVVMSVMNGFQMSFIDAILEVSSYHLRAVDVPEQEEPALVAACEADKHVRSCVPFYEAQALMTDSAGLIMGKYDGLMWIFLIRSKRAEKSFLKETV